MIRFNGNSILIADSDKTFGTQLCESLRIYGAQCFYAEDMTEAKDLLSKYQFDVVIANYYLRDGIILHLIDWCSSEVEVFPIFTCIGYPLVTDANLCKKQSIMENFSKNDCEHILRGLSHLLFDFKEFEASLEDMIIPNELTAQVKVGDANVLANPIEVSHQGVFLQFDEKIPEGTVGVLRFTSRKDSEFKEFVIAGAFEGGCKDGQVFKVHKHYLVSWAKLLKVLENKQISINKFMNRAAGF